MLQIALRILHAEIYLLKNVVNNTNKTIKNFVDIIKGRFEFKKDLTEILLTKIRHYELVNPMEVATFDHIHQLECNFMYTAQSFDVQHFYNIFRGSFFRLLKEMR